MCSNTETTLGTCSALYILSYGMSTRRKPALLTVCQQCITTQTLCRTTIQASVSLQFILTIDEMVYKVFPPDVTMRMLARQYEVKRPIQKNNDNNNDNNNNNNNNNNSSSSSLSCNLCPAVHPVLGKLMPAFFIIGCIFAYTYIIYDGFLGCGDRNQFPEPEVKTKIPNDKLVPQ
jgi:hypothetical protein